METPAGGDLSTIMMSTLMMNGSVNEPNHVREILTLASRITSITILVVIMVAMGCVIELQDIKATFRHPIAFFIGMACQFVLMPLIAFILAIALQLKTAWALSLLIMGCCPGGTNSNVFTHWAQGDTCLSVSMTTVSTAVAIGMMPLNLFIYGRYWTDEGAVIPYLNIFNTLLSICIPAAFGIVLRHFKPKVASCISKVGACVYWLLIVIAFTMVILINPTFYQADWQLWIAAGILPIFGFAIGYGLALLFRQPPAKCCAIAFETGTQNAGIAFSISILSFSHTDLFLDMILYPLIYGFLIYVDSFAALGAYRLYIRRKNDGGVDSKPEPRVTGVVSRAYTSDAGDDGNRGRPSEELEV